MSKTLKIICGVAAFILMAVVLCVMFLNQPKTEENPKSEKNYFSTASIEEIIKIANAGEAEKYFEVGEKRKSTFGDGTEFNYIILGFNHDDLADGSGKANMAIGIDRVAPYFNAMINRDPMLPSSAKISYENSDLRRTFFNEEALGNYHSEFKDAVKIVNKKCYVNGEITLVQDRLFLFSESELTGTSKQAGFENEGEQYEYFKTQNSFKRKLNQDLTFDGIELADKEGNAPYWLRTQYSEQEFGHVNAAGEVCDYDAEYSVAFASYAFCI